MTRLLLLLSFLLLAALAYAGCTAIEPFARVRERVPADRFVRVGSGLVHVETAGEGEPVVLLHGFGGSTYSYRKILPELARSHRAVAIDLYGFGWTERPRDPASYTREGQVDLVLGVMDRLGVDRAHLVGHSYGGAISLTLAFSHPERVRSLVLLDSARPAYPSDRRSRLATLRPLTWLYLRLVALRPGSIRAGLERSFFDDSLVTDELVLAYRERVRVEGIGPAFYGLTAPAAPGPEVVLEEIRTPALVIWGEEDALISVESGRQATERMPNARFVALPETGHLPMEERPEEVVRLMLEFLSGPARQLQ